MGVPLLCAMSTACGHGRRSVGVRRHGIRLFLAPCWKLQGRASVREERLAGYASDPQVRVDDWQLRRQPRSGNVCGRRGSRPFST